MIVDPDQRSEHGLAHILPPAGLSRAEFITACWQHVLDRDLEQAISEPAWLDDPALSQFTLTSPRLLAPFRDGNRGLAWAEQIKPFNFILVAHLAPLGHPDGVDPQRFRLITPYDRDLTRWAQMIWRNLYDPHGLDYTLTTSRHDATRGPRPAHVAEAQTIRTMLHHFAQHPEAKYADADGRRCGTRTRGKLYRRRITPARLRVIGKETNELDEVQVGLIGTVSELVGEYTTVDVELRDALKKLAGWSGRQLATQLGVDRRTVDRIRAGHTPRLELRQRIIRLCDVTAGPGGQTQPDSH